jgi:hypothetical protein
VSQWFNAVFRPVTSNMMIGEARVAIRIYEHEICGSCRACRRAHNTTRSDGDNERARSLLPGQGFPGEIIIQVFTDVIDDSINALDV